MQETEIINGLKQGNSRALAALYEKFYAALVYFAMRFCGDKQTSEDVINPLFEAVWERREKFDTLTNIKAFLYISARNRSLNVIRERNREREVLTEFKKQVEQITDQEAERSAVESETLRMIREEIESLPKKTKEVVKLRLRGFSFPEIAERLNKAESTIREQWRQAIRSLRMNIGPGDGVLLVISSMVQYFFQ